LSFGTSLEPVSSSAASLAVTPVRYCAGSNRRTYSPSRQLSDAMWPNWTCRLGAPGPIFAAMTLGGAVIVTASGGSVDLGSVTVTVPVTVSAGEEDFPLHPSASPQRARTPAAIRHCPRFMRRILPRARNELVTAF
jgi:hypothetical protein